jgi:hypothetical protein
VGGILDHYLFSYPHAVAFFWLYIGLAVAAARLTEARPESVQFLGQPQLDKTASLPYH